VQKNFQVQTLASQVQKISFPSAKNQLPKCKKSASQVQKISFPSAKKFPSTNISFPSAKKSAF
jgi:hypothetical protein